jgi:hypothetical protein
MRIAPPGWLPEARTEPEARIREARRRQRRRWLAAGVASAVVLAGVAGVAATPEGSAFRQLRRHHRNPERNHRAKPWPIGLDQALHVARATGF